MRREGECRNGDEDSFIFNLDTRCGDRKKAAEMEGVDLRLCRTQLFWLHLWKPFLCDVGIATGYGLEGPRIESRWGTRFCAPAKTGPGAHPAFYTRVTGSFPGVCGRGVALTTLSI